MIKYAYNGMHKTLATLIDAATTPAGQDEMGELLDGHLTFAGHLRRRINRTATTTLAPTKGSGLERNIYDHDNETYHDAPPIEGVFFPTYAWRTRPASIEFCGIIQVRT